MTPPHLIDIESFHRHRVDCATNDLLAEMPIDAATPIKTNKLRSRRVASKYWAHWLRAVYSQDATSIILQLEWLASDSYDAYNKAQGTQEVVNNACRISSFCDLWQHDTEAWLSVDNPRRLRVEEHGDTLATLARIVVVNKGFVPRTLEEERVASEEFSQTARAVYGPLDARIMMVLAAHMAMLVPQANLHANLK